jgi:hypothetical protein
VFVGVFVGVGVGVDSKSAPVLMTLAFRPLEHCASVNPLSSSIVYVLGGLFAVEPAVFSMENHSEHMSVVLELPVTTMEGLAVKVIIPLDSTPLKLTVLPLVPLERQLVEMLELPWYATASGLFGVHPPGVPCVPALQSSSK